MLSLAQADRAGLAGLRQDRAARSARCFTMAGCGGVWVGDAGCICLVREKRFVTRSFPCLEQPHLMRLLIALIFFAASALAQSAPASEAVLEVFVREDCPHCAAAKEYLPTIARERSDLQVVVRTIDNDAQA